MKKILYIMLIISVLFLVGCSGKYDAFAQCLTDKGAKMYGAFWCPHCIDQKEEFGKSFEHITYIECSQPSREQTPFCNQQNIQSYPTWEFADGSRQTGQVSFAELSRVTGCSIDDVN